MSARYGEPRRQAQLELRAAAAQIVVEAELVLRSLDELAGTPARQSVLERHHTDVLRRVSTFEAALHHLVNLELPASGAHAGQEPAVPESSKPRSGSPPADQHARPRLTIPIVGDPDKPKRPRHASPDPDATDKESGPADEPVPRLLRARRSAATPGLRPSAGQLIPTLIGRSREGLREAPPRRHPAPRERLADLVARAAAGAGAREGRVRGAETVQHLGDSSCST